MSPQRADLSSLLVRVLDSFSHTSLTGNALKVYQHQVRGLGKAWRRFLRQPTESDITDLSDRMMRLVVEVEEGRQSRATSLIRELCTSASLAGEEERYVAFKVVSGEKSSIGGLTQLAPGSDEWWDYDLLVVAALYDPELMALVSRMKNPHERVGRRAGALAGVSYFVGDLEGEGGFDSMRGIRWVRTVAVFQARTGSVDAAAVAAEAVRWFRPRVAVMVGVCAGRSGEGVALGDIVVPSECLTYDTGKITQNGFEPEPRWVSATPLAIRRAEVVGVEVLQGVSTELYRDVGQPARSHRIHTGVMACGSAVVNRVGAFDKISSINRKIVALEMESYGFLRAVELSDDRVVRFVVKGVMDHAEKKTDKAKGLAASLAARFLERFLLQEFWRLADTR